MRFTSIRRIAKSLNIDFVSVDEELIDKIHKKIESASSVSIDGYSFTVSEIQFIFDSLKTPQNLVFHDWIEQDSGLSNYLISNGEKRGKATPDLHQEHQLEKSYKTLISEFLFSSLDQNIKTSIQEDNISELAEHIAFSDYLIQSKKIEIQQHVSRFVRGKIENTDSKDYFDEVYSKEFTQILNHLDKHFYSDLVLLLDTSQNLIQTQDLEPNQLGRLRSALLRLNLTESHKNQVESFSKTDVFRVRKPNEQAPFKKLLKSPIFYLLSLIALILIFYPVFKNLPQKKNTVQITGVDSLSVDELLKMDSLMGFKVDTTPDKIDDLPSHKIQPDLILVGNWQDIENEVAQDIYKSMLEDFSIQKGLTSSCPETDETLFGTQVYNAISMIETSETNHTIKNDTEIELFVLFYEPEKEGKVYGVLIDSDSSAKVKIEAGMNFIFYSGRDMVRFNPLRWNNKGYGNSLQASIISKSFTHHFCEMDNYNLHVLNQIFEVRQLGKTTVFEKNSMSVYGIDSDAMNVKL